MVPSGKRGLFDNLKSNEKGLTEIGCTDILDEVSEYT